MEFSEVLKKRKMIRKYKKTAVPDELIMNILANAQRAPSAGFTQVQEFVIVKDEKTKQILNFVHYHPNIIYLTELVGGADLEIEFQVKSNEELYKYLKEMRERFAGIIRDYEFMQYTHEYKFSYLPEISEF